MFYVRRTRLVPLGLSLVLFAGSLIGWNVSTGYSSTVLQSGERRSLPTAEEVARFLETSTWGPDAELIAYVQQPSVGFDRFLEEQFAAPISSYPSAPLYPNVAPDDCLSGTACYRDNYTIYPIQNRFFVNALYGEDQLRQRVAFALHQIMVVSGADLGTPVPGRLIPYLQVLDRNAFGNFRQLLYEITLTPAMGNYLDMAGNNRTNPNENYAREVLQLFSIGLVRLNPDGTPQLDSLGQTIPTYDQQVVNGFARVFTGWSFAAAPAGSGSTNYTIPMVATQNNHDITAKTLLRGVTLLAGRTAVQDLNDALDNIFMDPNVGPFIGKQLIQHLVTSNPSPDYVRRITRVFDDNGFGVRGDLQAVVRAILLDDDASTDTPTPSPTGRTRVRPEAPTNQGHLKHPILLLTNLFRALHARSRDGATSSAGYLNPQVVNMGMDVYRPPSVFSYFSPSTGVTGTTLKGPEFGLLNTSTALRRANFINTMVFTGIAANPNPANVNGLDPTGLSLDFSPMQALAGNPNDLVSALNTLMMNGRMSPEMRQAIVTAVGALPASNTLRRVQTAVYLIGSSAQYQVAR